MEKLLTWCVYVLIGTIFIRPVHVFAEHENIDAYRPLLVVNSNHLDYVDARGHPITSLVFEDARDFSQGLARVQVEGKWGYLNKNGDLVIMPHFDEAGDFAEGYARVRVGSKWGYIDRFGGLAIDFRFDFARDFQDGLACVQIGRKWGYVDKLGIFRIEPRFAWAYSFSDGVARAGTKNSWGYINKDGRFVWTASLMHKDSASSLADAFSQADAGHQMPLALGKSSGRSYKEF